MMQWQQVRELFPDQFVLISVIEFHEEDDKKVITEVAPIREVAEQEANREFFNAKAGHLVYHTSNVECIVHLRRDPLMRVLSREQLDGDGYVKTPSSSLF
ncbi:hypothetical protein PA598K_06057 [Paenibacillus sp. 598K]|uniref:hypothetical protein n=1 Tax=Paenibacillus sp. 598K TaxID=1117987 RepID=UPI000FFAAE7F|nr:hypothetical protein [Paenibacillus sp. 598K]GBF77503.1 hypothetical protein PA598K_06057 [Paenibacillus sp. 598K]